MGICVVGEDYATVAAVANHLSKKTGKTLVYGTFAPPAGGWILVNKPCSVIQYKQISSMGYNPDFFLVVGRDSRGLQYLIDQSNIWYDGITTVINGADPNKIIESLDSLLDGPKLQGND